MCGVFVFEALLLFYLGCIPIQNRLANCVAGYAYSHQEPL